MLENIDAEVSQKRLMRSARVLKTYFECKLKLRLKLLTEPPVEPLNEGLQFDMTISRLGIWGLHASAPLSEKNQAEISATFHGVLSALDKIEDRRSDLVFMEGNVRSLIEDMPSNVIPIRRNLHSRPAFSIIRDKRWMLRLDCLIESPDAAEIHKMALELHSQGQRYAFVEYKDLERSCRLNLSELHQLGAITLFIPSILSLSILEQQVLRELIQQDTVQRPLLMVGANVSYADLRTEPNLDLEFLALLSRAYIKLTRPFAEYKSQGLIHYFLDSLS